MHFVFHL